MSVFHIFSFSRTDTALRKTMDDMLSQPKGFVSTLQNSKILMIYMFMNRIKEGNTSQVTF